MNYNKDERMINMDKDYMTIGELAKKMKTTVRTLQFYDQKGLLIPSMQSDGKRRLYTYQDMVQLHQIQSLKSLGFSLDEIKNQLEVLDTPEKVEKALSHQALLIQEKIQQLTKTLSDIKTLKEEVIQMQSVNFKTYADIIVNLQMNNENYWVIKYFDEQTLDYLRRRFNKDSGLSFIEKFTQISQKVLELKNQGVDPLDERVQVLAKQFWQMVEEFTNGDMSMLPQLMKFNELDDQHEWAQQQNQVNAYLQPALGLYFQKAGIQLGDE